MGWLGSNSANGCGVERIKLIEVAMHGVNQAYTNATNFARTPFAYGPPSQGLGYPQNKETKHYGYGADASYNL